LLQRWARDQPMASYRQAAAAPITNANGSADVAFISQEYL
jgi:hypothetical protein